MRTKAILFFVAALVAVGCATPGGGDGDSGTAGDGSPAGGLTLLIHPTVYEAIGGDDFTNSFSEEHGVPVDVVTAPIGEHLERAMVEFRAGSGRFDLIAFQNVDYMPRINEGLLPLGDYVESAPEDWDWTDFVVSLREFAQADGQQVGVPIRLGTQMLYYREDLLEQESVAPPATLQEYVDAALQLDTGGVHGAVQRGAPRELANDWLGFLYSAGGTILDDGGQCAVDGGPGQTATSLLATLFQQEALPEDYLAWGRDDYIGAMQQGNAAMGVYFSPYYGSLVDEAESTVSDDVGYALAPTAPDVADGTSRAQTWNLSISRDSANPDLAWQFIQEITGKDNALVAALENGNGPVRTSTFQAPDYQEAFPVADLWLESAEAAKVDPAINELPEIIDVIANQITEAVNGSTEVEAALTDACSEINNILS